MITRSLFYPNAPESTAVPIGINQTAPTQKAAYFLAGLLNLNPTDKVLEIGTGSGYQACVLAESCAEVYTIELPEKVEPLICYANIPEIKELRNRIYIHRGDGKNGWPYPCIFDAILVTCAVREISPAWVDQLKDGGILVVPRGTLAIEVWEKRWGKLKLKRVAGYANFTSLE